MASAPDGSGSSSSRSSLASIAVFAILAVLPGDPAPINAGTTATPAQVEALRKEYGLDAPVATRYVRLGRGS